MSQRLVPALPQRYLENCKVFTDRVELISRLSPGGVFVEIGVALGDFSEKVLDIYKPSSFYAIDIFTLHQWPDTWGGRVGRELGTATHREYFERRFRNQDQVKVFEGNSADILPEILDHSIDVAYVDADHEYSAVKNELGILKGKMNAGGVIILNDYIMFDHFRLMPYGVVQACHEFMLEHDWEMFALALHPDMFCDVALRPMARS